MLQSIFNALFSCSHQRTTFPLTRASRTYVVCLDCGREFAYNWANMRIGAPVPARAPVVQAQPIFR